MEVRHKSMKAFGESLANANEQLKIINNESNLPHFDEKYELVGEGELHASNIEIMQVNVGKMCNQVCKHCHVDAGPDRKEIMTKETMQICIDILKQTDIPTVDLTGGAPELNPNFKWFVDEIKKLDRHVIVRSNLTILKESGFQDLPKFMANHKCEIVSSLPFYKKTFTDKQRGDGVFDKSISAIKNLNELGFGKEGSGLILNFVYNPVGAFLPPSQEGLENDYKRELFNTHGVVFNNLYTITNMPISRFLDYLVQSGNYESYMQKLVDSFNPSAATNVMCKFTISVGWDGQLFDCDFNQMLEMNMDHGAPDHIKDFDMKKIENRRIVTAQHCYGCTAGAGSSCGGATA
ncbi:MAG: arsenosugar biosynthesis radical SAM protein ArsS [Ignavibacteria bacterium]|nr:arsenosugar biosynthesis radical SAM protein ArsS [Ignavibacteria bacterium]MBT8380754.1 arsenosugar biosynthesis radical SAM protein ArsS [Ignavibacteria bacterium]MBT8390271.1 arsenosugar biosynthesis radical SAM protein ArsS [Ignavibacteria bacterium]NNJ53203.1 radical SAM/Cys-rich domain protein [Ignavibacteriaceae bacterium]NNL22312.1 radical SAM/Cys-rich domain protein [Ignavibacteriaceae bacterium]